VADKETRTNADIRSPMVRLIDVEGNQVGVINIREALKNAQEAGLDLVEISPNADPPVCRVMDYDKYRFEQKKRLTSGKKKQKQTQVKEIKFRPVTDVGDYDVKLRKLRKFLENNDKVKITVRFRGREMMHRQLGFDLLSRVEKDLSDLGTVEQHPKVEGKQLVMVISPGKK
jgi:translation initiation factor IF-3